MKKLRLGMIGGGQDSFIGAVHRIASRIDDQWSLEAGCLSSTPERAIASAKEIGLPFDRSYTSFQEMAEAEKGEDDPTDPDTKTEAYVRRRVRAALLASSY